jgi:mercuric ion transport protein
MSDKSANSVAPRRGTQGAGALLLTLAGLGSAFSLASCCALPILLAAAGLGTAWLGGIADLAVPYRVPLIAISGVSLAGGAVSLLRQRRVCAPGAVCARPAVRGTTALGLILGLVLLYLGYVYV